MSSVYNPQQSFVLNPSMGRGCYGAEAWARGSVGAGFGKGNIWVSAIVRESAAVELGSGRDGGGQERCG